MKQKLYNKFDKISTRFSNFFGSPYHFMAWVVLIGIWILLGPPLHFSDSWQLTINTPTTIIELFAAISIQYVANKVERQSRSIQQQHEQHLAQIEDINNDLHIHMLQVTRALGIQNPQHKRIIKQKGDYLMSPADAVNTAYAQHNGQPWEVEDPSNPDQCMDLAFGVIDLMGIPRDTIRHMFAYEVFTQPNDLTRKYFDIIPNAPDNAPSEGDFVVWAPNTPLTGPVGHIDVAKRNITTTSFIGFDQNWDTVHHHDPNGNPICREVEHSYESVLGWLHPKVTVQSAQITNQGGPNQVWVEQSQIDAWLHGPDGIDYWKGQAYSLTNELNTSKDQLTQANSQITQLQATNTQLTDQINQLSAQAQLEPSKPSAVPSPPPAPEQVVTTNILDPAPNPPAQAEPVTQPVTVTHDVKSDTTINSVNPPIDLVTKTDGAVVDLQTGHAVASVPAGTSVRVVAETTRQGTDYVLTDKMVASEHGIAASAFIESKPIDGISATTNPQADAVANDITGGWKHVVNFLHKIHNNKKETTQ